MARAILGSFEGFAGEEGGIAAYKTGFGFVGIAEVDVVVPAGGAAAALLAEGVEGLGLKLEGREIDAHLAGVVVLGMRKAQAEGERFIRPVFGEVEVGVDGVCLHRSGVVEHPSLEVVGL